MLPGVENGVRAGFHSAGSDSCTLLGTLLDAVQTKSSETAMSHVILLSALVLYAIAMLLTLRNVGLGLVQTLASGVMTIAFVWSALHLVYVSDVLHAAVSSRYPLPLHRFPCRMGGSGATQPGTVGLSASSSTCSSGSRLRSSGC